ncbi:LysR family transcriptional regulator [Saccharopolyspora spinosa]|uniref:LysR family transcriptional regulator n=1 Tax=Saccharopolyspora spinosa TaxID=60894 RepID=UPI00374A68D7
MAGNRSNEEATSGLARQAREPSIHQLRLFLALADELHFGRVAARLFISQSALSKQLRALETRLGVKLFERNSRAVVLTTAGEALLPEAHAVTAAMSGVLQRARLHARMVTGHLVVGQCGADAALPYARTTLAGLRRRHPGISVEVRSLNFAGQISALNRGEVDVAFVRPPVPPGIQTLDLATEPRVACLPADDPLATEKQLTLAQLADRAVADAPPEVSRNWWDYWTVNPRPDGTPVRYGPTVTDIEALLATIALGEAMMFVPASTKKLFPRAGVAYIEVVDLPLCGAALAWTPENRTRPDIAAIRECARRGIVNGRE